MSPSIPLEKMKRVVQTTLEGLNARDYDIIISVRSTDFKFQVLPRSLGQPVKDMDGCRRLWDDFLMPTFKEFKVTPTNQIFDAEQKKAIVYTTVEITTVLGEYSVEMIQIYTLDEQGDQLIRLEEFFDSKVYQEVAAAFGLY